MNKPPKSQRNARFSLTPKPNASPSKPVSSKPVSSKPVSSKLVSTGPVSSKPVETQSNQPPQLYPVDDQHVHPERALNVSIGAFDPDGDNLTFQLVSGPTGAAVEPQTGEFVWTPGWEHVGAHNVVIRVTDSHGASDQTSFVVDVENASPQLAPLPNQTTHPGESLNFQAQAFDPDGDELTYELVQGPANATLDPMTGQFQWTPDWSDLGSVLITIRVTDPGGESDQDSCVITVANQRPQLEPMMDLHVFVDELASFTAAAFDPDGDALSYQLIKGPSGSSVDPSMGQFTWQPTSGDVGSHIVTIRVSDPGGASDQRSCIVTVHESPPSENPPEPLA